MSDSGRRRILVAVDGSHQAFEAVRYVGEIMRGLDAEIVLFHVVTKVPDSFFDSEKIPAVNYQIINIDAWEERQEKLVDECMETAKRVLLETGFPENAVTVMVRVRKTGIARDIIEEAQAGYDAVAVGRVGLSELKDLVMGSIATKMLQGLCTVPLWIVGNRPKPGRVLIGMDASPGAMVALDHVAHMLAGAQNCSITLFHVVRGQGVFRHMFERAPVSGEVHGEARSMEEVEAALLPVFQEARSRLEKAGIGPRCIDHKIVMGGSSRAGSLVEESRREGYDTIVVGRRGLTRVQEFFMGRVGNKIIQLAHDKATWIVE